MYHRKNAKMKKHTGVSSQGHVCHSMLFYLNSFISTYDWMRINVVLMKETCTSFRVNSQIVLQLLEISGLDFLKRQNSNLISTLPRFDCTLQIRVKLWLFLDCAAGQLRALSSSFLAHLLPLSYLFLCLILKSESQISQSMRSIFPKIGGRDIC